MSNFYVSDDFAAGVRRYVDNNDCLISECVCPCCSSKQATEYIAEINNQGVMESYSRIFCLGCGYNSDKIDDDAVEEPLSDDWDESELHQCFSLPNIEGNPLPDHATSDRLTTFSTLWL